MDFKPIIIISAVVIALWFLWNRREQYTSALKTTIQPFMHNEKSAVFDPEQFVQPRTPAVQKQLMASNLRSILIDPSENEGVESAINFSTTSFEPTVIPLKEKNRPVMVDHFGQTKNVEVQLTPVYTGAYQITYVLNVSKPDGSLQMLNFGNSKEKARAMWKERYPNVAFPDLIK